MKNASQLPMRALAVAALLFVFLSFKGEPEKSGIETAVNTFINDPALRNAGIGFCMKEVSSGALKYQHNSQQSLIPASTLKIVTTYTGLKMLGADYRFKTTLAYTGKIDSTGTLNGNILIMGGGDPTLGSGRMQGTYPENLMTNWVAAIRKAGIKKVNGGVVSDVRRYEEYDLPRDWPLEDIGNYYGAAASALSYRENLYKIILKPGKKVGDRVELLRTEPRTEIHFTNQLKTGPAGSGDNAYVLLDNAGNHYLQGTIPLGKETFSIKGARPYPYLLCEIELQNRLGIDASPAWEEPLDTTVLTESASPVLAEIVMYTNLNSVNLYAEHLLKEMGYMDTRGLPGTTQNGAKAVMRIVKEQGINTSGFFMSDGCGLSRSNAISAGFLTDVLQKAFSTDGFYESLPVAGRSKAMSGIGDGTIIDGNMRSKTGHMERVRSYAGYVKGKDGKMYSFALIVNNYSCSPAEIKQKIEKLLIALGQ